MWLIKRILSVVLVVFIVDHSCANDGVVSFDMTSDSVVVLIDGQRVTEYFVRDPSTKIQRPYFSHVKTIEGVQVTRSCPPGPDDRQDHATMHPGIWLAFGDISGVDFWRNKGRIEHVEFVRPPAVKDNTGSIAIRNRYVDEKGREVCIEKLCVEIVAYKDFYMLQFDSIFSGMNHFSFGDQEEMGLGIRVVSPLSEKHGGHVLVPAGITTAKKFWGQPISWCDFSGTVENKRVGIALFCSPQNHYQSWCHCRDYGLLVANCFGRHAMRQGEKSHVDVHSGQSLRLQYAVVVHGDMNAKKISSVYEQYCSTHGSTESVE